MTEQGHGRIDLTALGLNDPDQAEAVIRAAMTQIRASSERAPLLADVVAWWRPGLAAAAAIALLSVGVAVARQRSGPPAPLPVEARVLDWAESGHVPSNGELLATFQGYSR